MSLTPETRHPATATTVAPLPWVLLRGLTRGAGHWGNFPADLAAALPPGTPVHTVDLPGNGSRWRERSPARVAALARALQDSLGAAGLHGPVHLLALSLGAMVAVELARLQPRTVASAVLVNTSLRPFSPPWQRLRPGAWPGLAALAAGIGSPLRQEATVLRLTSRRATAAEVLPHWLALRQAQPVAPANALRQLWAAARYRAPQAPPPVPWLLLVGEGDQLVNPVCSHRLAERWNVACQAHPQAGHDLPLDAPHWVIDQVLLHLARWRHAAPCAGVRRGAQADWPAVRPPV